MSKPEEPVVLYRGSTVAASYLKGLLEHEGIEVFLWGDAAPRGLAQLRRHNPLSPEKGWGVDVVVAQRDAGKAQPIVKQFLDDKLFSS